MKTKLTMMMMCLLWGVSAFGSQEITIRNNDKIEVVMSQNDVNRISVINDQIKSVFASQDKVHVLPEEDRGQIFVTPKLKNGLPFAMSLVMRSGTTIDLTVRPIQGLSETILLRLDKRSADEFAKEKRHKERLLKKLIKGALKGQHLKGYRILEHEDNSVDKDNKSLIQKQSYIGSKYKILIFSYTNLKKTKQIISEQMFKISPDSIAVFVSKKTLAPNETTKIVVVEEIKQQIKHL